MAKGKSSKKEKVISLIAYADQTSPVTEQYRTIRTNVHFSMVDQNLRSLVVTSSGPGEGKSTTSANLAVIFASSGIRVLLVDADMRKSTVHKTFNLPNMRGLSSFLRNRTLSLDEVVELTSIENLTVLTSGPKPANPAELLGSKRMDQVMDEIIQSYDLVIFDMPPIVSVTDAQILAGRADGTILVVRDKVSLKQSLLRAKALLENVNANVLGVVYNGVDRNHDSGYYYSYGV